MVAAYRAAESGRPVPDEIADDLEAARLIDRFGAQVVFGRPMGYEELQRIMWAENANAIYRAYIGRQASNNWAEWAQKYPRENAALISVARLIEETE